MTTRMLEEAAPSLLKPEQVYLQLKRSILDGTLAPGTHLTETDLCSQLNTSRTPVHQAVTRLSDEHMIQLLPKKGLIVLELQMQDVVNLYNVSEALESKAAALAADGCSAYHLQRLEHLSSLIDNPPSDNGEKDDRDLNYIFHIAVAEASGNDILLGFIQTTRERLSLLRFSKKLALANLHDVSRTEESHDVSHTKIVEAIREHNSPLAFERMQQHISLTKNRILKHYFY
ncbi:MAG: GntR family transcriptional regulator [Lachnospiraceae bacterium]|nr:GntR family transcriptional regulator [Lachnospiraceae bacterium]